MLIKFGQKTPSEEAIFDAKVKLVREKLRNVDATEQERHDVAAQLAQQYRGRPVKNKFSKHCRHVAEVPSDDWFRLTSKYGIDECHSPRFIRYLQKRFPALATAKI